MVVKVTLGAKLGSHVLKFSQVEVAAAGALFRHITEGLIKLEVSVVVKVDSSFLHGKVHATIAVEWLISEVVVFARLTPLLRQHEVFSPKRGVGRTERIDRRAVLEHRVALLSLVDCDPLRVLVEVEHLG